MASEKFSYDPPPAPTGHTVKEPDIESEFIEKLSSLKYIHRSGKTLTSFKASTLFKENDHIQKCVFVVDRKDLDRQTREEFNRFQEGCVEENTNTATLVRRLLSEDYTDKVIVTTIQKIGLAVGETSKLNKQRKKHDLCFTKAPRFVINGASRAIQYYYSMPCAGGWNQTQNK